MAGTFEVYEDRGGTFRFRLRAVNGEVVATGEAYGTRRDAHRGCQAVIAAVGVDHIQQAVTAAVGVPGLVQIVDLWPGEE